MAKQSAWGLIQKEKLFLFIKRSPQTTRAGQWCPPGGSVKAFETPEEGCIREVREEIGLDVTIEKKLYQIGTFHYFLCNLEDEKQSIHLKPNECVEYQWVALEKLLELGEVMELRKMKKVLMQLHISLPSIPNL